MVLSKFGDDQVLSRSPCVRSIWIGAGYQMDTVWMNTGYRLGGFQSVISGLHGILCRCEPCLQRSVPLDGLERLELNRVKEYNGSWEAGHCGRNEGYGTYCSRTNL